MSRGRSSQLERGKLVWLKEDAGEVERLLISLKTEPIKSYFGNSAAFANEHLLFKKPFQFTNWIISIFSSSIFIEMSIRDFKSSEWTKSSQRGSESTAATYPWKKLEYKLSLEQSKGLDEDAEAFKMFLKVVGAVNWAAGYENEWKHDKGLQRLPISSLPIRQWLLDPSHRSYSRFLWNRWLKAIIAESQTSPFTDVILV